MDFSNLNDASGLNSDELLQQQYGGDSTMLHFVQGSQEFHQESFKSGVTFEWVKNKVAQKLFANYEDVSLYMNEKRIPEPFCLVDLNVKSGQVIRVEIAAGAVYGEEALRQQVLKDIEDEEEEAKKNGGNSD